MTNVKAVNLWKYVALKSETAFVISAEDILCQLAVLRSSIIVLPSISSSSQCDFAGERRTAMPSASGYAYRDTSITYCDLFALDVIYSTNYSLYSLLDDDAIRFKAAHIRDARIKLLLFECLLQQI